jgi:hypothetical protein
MKPECSDATQRSQLRLPALGQTCGFSLCAAIVGVAVASARAEDVQARRGDSPRAQSAPTPTAGVSLVIVDPPELRAGVASSIEVVVRVPETEERPLLLTPMVEGEALHVVRGRMLRADARRDPDGTLHFAIPVLGRRAGTAVLRVALLAYRCAPRAGCEAVRVSRSRTLQVAGP